jgi:hypothetical protein
MTTHVDWVRDSFAQKLAAGIFAPVNKHITADHEDRYQEAISKTFEVFKRNAERGKVMDDALLVHAARVRANDLDHRFAGAAGARPKGDVFDARNYLRGRLEVLRIDGHGERNGGSQLGFGLADETSLNPTHRFISAIDLRKWLAGLPEIDQDMVGMRAAGRQLAARVRAQVP